MEDGSGGRESRDLIRKVLLPCFHNPLLDPLDDAAVFAPEKGKGKMAFTTDSYVVTPLFFPGGDIGKLAVCGTVNDLAMVGAHPLYLSCALIIEEGLELGILEKTARSLADWAQQAGVQIVTGDTKVVEKGNADGLYINTAGIGTIPAGFRLFPEEIKPGDVIVVSGTIADHGLAILAAREELDIAPQLFSDCAPLSGLVEALIASGGKIKFLRDPTRGGIAAIVNEIVEGKEWGNHSGRRSPPPLFSGTRSGGNFRARSPFPGIRGETAGGGRQRRWRQTAGNNAAGKRRGKRPDHRGGQGRTERDGRIADGGRRQPDYRLAPGRTGPPDLLI